MFCLFDHHDEYGLFFSFLLSLDREEKKKKRVFLLSGNRKSLVPVIIKKRSRLTRFRQRIRIEEILIVLSLVSMSTDVKKQKKLVLIFSVCLSSNFDQIERAEKEKNSHS